MKDNRIIYISILGLLATAIILSNVKEVQNKEYLAEEIQQSNSQFEEDEAATTLFKYLPVNGWSNEGTNP